MPQPLPTYTKLLKIAELACQRTLSVQPSRQRCLKGTSAECSSTVAYQHCAPCWPQRTELSFRFLNIPTACVPLLPEHCQPIPTVRCLLCQQGAALRGVRDMFQGKPGEPGPSAQPQAVPLELAKQPWMDLPDWQLTPQQRTALKEHEQKLRVCAPADLTPCLCLHCLHHMMMMPVMVRSCVAHADTMLALAIHAANRAPAHKGCTFWLAHPLHTAPLACSGLDTEAAALQGCLTCRALEPKATHRRASLLWILTLLQGKLAVC